MRASYLALAAAIGLAATPALAERQGFLETVHKHQTLALTTPDNGDLNPYAVVVAPTSAGKVAEGDVLISNFNNISNLQGTGTTIVDFNPATRKTTLFAQIPRDTAQCPGGVGLTTAMTMLKSGWVIVGSLPSKDGTTATRGEGCLLVLDAQGKLVATWSGPTISGPWGNMAVVDKGDAATLFISMAGFDVPGPRVLDPATHYPVVQHKATVLRLELTVPAGKPPVLTSQTVVASGLAQRADIDNFLFGPTGLALGEDDTLYATNGLENTIIAIDHASTRQDSGGTGRIVTQDGLLAWPLALAWTPEKHLIVTNGKNGQVVEVDPKAGKQIYAQWIDNDQAQSPPGNGDLFGLAMLPDGSGFYYVTDDMNTLMKAGR
ncbi:MAG TPA: hypothetical protein VN222_17130 [Novosphingobium sp.]|nr:hypothetical protein [Novosphingobium sp.]HZV11012.1 hypothetical protein [Novosphingobium sp.]